MEKTAINKSLDLYTIAQEKIALYDHYTDVMEAFAKTKDVIDMTGYSQASIARKIKDGVLPIAKKEGNRNLFDKKVVEELINQGKLKRNKKVQ